MFAVRTQSRCSGAALSMGAGILAALVFFPSWAIAETAKEAAVLAVRGKGLEQEKAIAVQAVTEAVTRAGWRLAQRTFTPQQAEELVKCLPAEQPWPCLTKSVRDTAVRRLAVLSLESQPTADGTPMTVVTVQIASADQQDITYGGRRYCQPCSPDSLSKLTTAAAGEVLERMYLNSGKTFLQVKSRPLGAIVSVDGKRMGVTDVAVPILPGPHRVEVAHPQYVAQTRTIEAEEGKTALIDVVFAKKLAEGTIGGVRPEGAARQVDRLPSPRPSRLLPISLLAGGALLAAGGAAALLADEDAIAESPNPKDPQSQSYRNTAPLGIGLIAAGAAVIGSGGWLWWRGSASARRQRSPSAALIVHPGGAAVSLSSFF